MKSLKRRIQVVAVSAALMAGAGAATAQLTASAATTPTAPPAKVTTASSATNGCVVSQLLKIAVCIPRF